MFRVKWMVLISVVAAAPLLGSCDFLRSMAGRPTSEQLQQLLSEQEQVECRRDTLTEETLPEPSDSLLEALSLRGTVPGYIIVVGAYRIPEHAERKADGLRKRGYEVCIVERGGLNAVGIYQPGDREEALVRMRQLRAIGICPRSAWIMKNE